MKRSKIIILILLFIFILGAIFLYFNYSLLKLNRSTNNLYKSTNSQDLKQWRQELKKSKITKKNIFNEDLSDFQILKNYIDFCKNYNQNHFIKLSKIQIQIESEYEKDIEFENKTLKDDNFIKDKVYIYQIGQTGLEKRAKLVIQTSKSNSQTLDLKTSDIRIKEDNIKVIGTKDLSLVKQDINILFDNYKNQNSKTDLKYKDFKFNANINNVQTAQISTQNTTNNVDKILDLTQDLGKISISQTNCKPIHFLKVFYNSKDKKFYLEDFNKFQKRLCGKDNIVQLTCIDCFLAPVDKQHQLISNYTPILQDTNLSGGGQLTPQTVNMLKNLFLDANSKKIYPRISSAYRSYNWQLKTFQYFLNQYLKSGYSKEKANILTNQRVANPGYSEHQLGTAVDLNGVGVYEYLNKNAHKFGFIISYPKGSENVSGYMYEPWHIRYIGVQNASLYYQNKANYKWISEFLLENGEF